METDWKEPPTALVLGPQEIHVWRVQVEEWLPAIPQLRTFLDPEELARAQRFYFENDQQRSIIARGLLRVLLGRYCAIDPGKILFNYNEFGKPDLVAHSSTASLYFNLAHSHTQIVYAFTGINRIGVDIEYMRDNIEYEQVAQHYFSAHEKAQLQVIPSEQKKAAFFAGWTRKEAYIKACGKGLSIPLDSFDVTLQPGKVPCLLDSRENPRSAYHWSLYTLPPDPHYAGALALEGTCASLHFWHLSYPF